MFCFTEQFAPQKAVTNTYPTMVDGALQSGDVTKGGFDAEYLIKSSKSFVILYFFHSFHSKFIAKNAFAIL